MVRNYQRKTKSIDAEKLAQAIKAVQRENMSLRSAAKKFGMTLCRYCTKARASDPDNTSTSASTATFSATLKKSDRVTVFSSEQESALMGYLLKCSNFYFGLAPREVKLLAYQFAKKLKINFPNSWDVNEMAGVEWFRGFMKRHPTLAIRKPEAISLQRAIACNRTNVGLFFYYLRSLLATISNREAFGTWTKPVSQPFRLLNEL